MDLYGPSAVFWLFEWVTVELQIKFLLVSSASIKRTVLHYLVCKKYKY